MTKEQALKAMVCEGANAFPSAEGWESLPDTTDNYTVFVPNLTAQEVYDQLVEWALKADNANPYWSAANLLP